jgi:hypothetical protein
MTKVMPDSGRAPLVGRQLGAQRSCHDARHRTTTAARLRAGPWQAWAAPIFGLLWLALPVIDFAGRVEAIRVAEERGRL